MNSIHAFTKRGISARTALFSLNTLKMSNIKLAPRPITTAAAFTVFLTAWEVTYSAFCPDVFDFSERGKFDFIHDALRDFPEWLASCVPKFTFFRESFV